MMMVRGSTLFALGFVALMVYTMLAPEPSKRIERACEPTLWLGNVFVSITALTLPKYQDNVGSGFESLDYACRYSIWRLFYEFNRDGNPQEDDPIEDQEVAQDDWPEPDAVRIRRSE